MTAGGARTLIRGARVFDGERLREAAHGADYLKLYLEDPVWYGSPGMSAATVDALVAAAHARGMLTIAHADSAATARMFIQAGGDALAHVLGDLEVTPAFRADLRRRPAFVIATLRVAAVLSAAQASLLEADQHELAGHPGLEPFLDAASRAVFTRPGLLPKPAPASRPRDWRPAGSTSAARCASWPRCTRPACRCSPGPTPTTPIPSTPTRSWTPSPGTASRCTTNWNCWAGPG